MPAATTAREIDEVPSTVVKLFNSDPRVVRVTYYADGWVPNAYRWPAPGRAEVWTRRPDGSLDGIEITYDRKRSHGKGPTFVAVSARGGRLASV